MTSGKREDAGVVQPLERIHADLATAGWQFPSVEAAKKAWASHVNDVAVGYWGTIDDYTNAMTSRDYLADVLRRLPPDSARNLRAGVEKADTGFRDATCEMPGVIGRFYRHPDEWWWNRVPLKLGELADDLSGIAEDGSQSGGTGS